MFDEGHLQCTNYLGSFGIVRCRINLMNLPLEGGREGRRGRGGGGRRGGGNLQSIPIGVIFFGALCSLVSRNSPFSVLGTHTDWYLFEMWPLSDQKLIR